MKAYYRIFRSNQPKATLMLVKASSKSEAIENFVQLTGYPFLTTDLTAQEIAGAI